MSLREKIDADLKTAMLAKDQTRVLALRNIKSAAKNKEIDTKKPLDDAEMTQLLSSMKKKIEESISQYKAGGREDLVEKEAAELAIIQTFLPKAMEAAEIDAIIQEAIKTSGAAAPSDMGKVMKLVTPQTTGRADGKLVSERVKALLANK